MIQNVIMVAGAFWELKFRIAEIRSEFQNHFHSATRNHHSAFIEVSGVLSSCSDP